MRSSDELFELIKSLSKSEKRYLKLYAVTHKKGSTPVNLFNIIDMQKVYNEGAILKHFDNKHLSVVKVRLYNFILKVLRPYNSSSPYEQLKDLLHDVRILYEKGLYIQCEKALSKARDIAYRYEKFLQILEILGWKKVLLQARGYPQKSGSNLEDIIKEEASISEKLENERKYKDIRYTLFKHYTQNSIARNEEEMSAYRKIFDNDLCSHEDKALSFNAKIDFYFIHSVYYHSIGDLINSYPHYKRIVDLFEAFPERLYEQLTHYIAALSNFYSICSLVKKYEECLPIIKKMRKITAKSIKTEIFIFRMIYLCELALYLHIGEYNKGKALIKDIEQGIRLYKEKIPNSVIVIFYFNIVYLYFGIGDYSRSLFWLNKILNDPVLKHSRTDIHCFSYIMNLIIHFEIGNMELLEYIVKSTYRFLNKRNRLYKFETSVLNFIRKKLLKINTSKELIEAFKELKPELEEIIKDRFEKQALEYFDFISWLESKIENRPFAEVVREKAKTIS